MNKDFSSEYIIKVSDPKIGMSGVLVIDDTALGVGKGGIRMTSSVSEEEVYRLAHTMTWKNALAGIPFGGAKGGIVWPPKNGSGDDKLKKQYIQSFARAIKPFVPSKYIAGPDVNTGEREMQWFVEAVGSKKGATGKPKKLSGLPHELGSTGYGVFLAAQTAARLMKVNLKGARIAIEGFGNVGTFAFKFLAEAGATIVAVSDRGGTIFKKDGLDYNLLMKTKKSKKTVAEYPGGTKMLPDDIFGLAIDILIPAAVTDVINEKNKDLVKARLIVEGSNIPMRENIEKELFDKGIMIVPDFVANAGGVISSYCEYMGYSADKMFKVVKEKITKSTEQVIKSSLSSGRNPREVALEIAQNKVWQAMKRRKSVF